MPLLCKTLRRHQKKSQKSKNWKWKTCLERLNNNLRQLLKIKVNIKCCFMSSLGGYSWFSVHPFCSGGGRVPDPRSIQSLRASVMENSGSIKMVVAGLWPLRFYFTSSESEVQDRWPPTGGIINTSDQWPPAQGPRTHTHTVSKKQNWRLLKRLSLITLNWVWPVWVLNITGQKDLQAFNQYGRLTPQMLWFNSLQLNRSIRYIGW